MNDIAPDLGQFLRRSFDPRRGAHPFGVKQRAFVVQQARAHPGDHVDISLDALQLIAHVHAQRFNLRDKRLHLVVVNALNEDFVDDGILFPQLIQLVPGAGEDIVNGMHLVVQPAFQPVRQLHAAHALVWSHAVVIKAIAPAQPGKGIGTGQFVFREHLADGSHGVEGQHLAEHDDQNQCGKQLFHGYSSPVTENRLPIKEKSDYFYCVLV